MHAKLRLSQLKITEAYRIRLVISRGSFEPDEAAALGRLTAKGDNLFAIDSDRGLVAFGNYPNTILNPGSFFNRVTCPPADGIDETFPHAALDRVPAVGIDQHAIKVF